MPGGGGMSQTAVNRMTGARTQIAGLVTAAMTLLTMLLLSPLLGLMPHAVLAGVVIVYSIGLIQPADFRNILRIRRTEFIWAAAAFLGVMLIGTLKGILVAIIVSLVALAQQTANPPVYVLGRKPRNQCVPAALARTSGRRDVSRAAAAAARGPRVLPQCRADRGASMRPLIAEAKPKVVVLDISGVFDLEYSALKMLTEAEARRREAGVMVWLAGLTPDVYAAMQRSAAGRDAWAASEWCHNLEISQSKTFGGTSNDGEQLMSEFVEGCRYDPGPAGASQHAASAARAGSQEARSIAASDWMSTTYNS